MAKQFNEKKEWRCNGLTVTMIVRMEDVTLAMLDEYCQQ
jgi:hypothetical protein